MSDKTDFEIDPYRLDEEWVEQPRLYHMYAVELAEARKDLEEAKRMRDVAKAEADKLVRNEPERFGLSKVTENAIKETIPTVPEVQQAEKEVIEARYAMDIAEAAVGAMDHRKRALEGLVSLHLADYFSKPKVPKGAEEGIGESKRKAGMVKGVRQREQHSD